MKQKWIIFCITCLITICSLENTFAFDGQRKGFILGIGLGAGFTTYQPEIDFYGQTFEFDRESKFTPVTDFKIGYSFTEQLQFYWMSKVAFIEFDDLLITGVAGLGVSYFLSPEPEGIYVTGGLGYSSWSSPDNSYTGLGLSMGVGYEFAKHWSIEGNITYGNPGDDSVKFDPFGIKITINALAY